MSCFCEKKEGIKKISELKRKSSNFEGMKKSLIPSHKIGSIGSIGRDRFKFCVNVKN